jgi:hypothetical protein
MDRRACWRAWPPALIASLLLAACAQAPRVAVADPPATPTPTPAGAPMPAASAKSAWPSGSAACAALAGGVSTAPKATLVATTASVRASSPSSADDPPSPEAEVAKAPGPAPAASAAPAAATGAPVNLADKIKDRASELAAEGTGDEEAAKVAASGRTARAAELYAAAWRISPSDWHAGFEAVGLWARIGDDVRAAVLLKGIEAAATAAQDDDVTRRAHALDAKLGLASAATEEAVRLWRRTFALENEDGYIEAVEILRRLQAFEPTAPGYYVREASFFARCGDGKRAGDAIARGSAAGVSYTGRWAPARDPELARLWSDPEFASTMRDTLGDAGVEQFEEGVASSEADAGTER